MESKDIQRAAYLADIEAWVRQGRAAARRPSTAAYGLLLSDFSSEELHQAEDRGDPRPIGVTSWIWLHNTKRDLTAWHNAIREVCQGTETFSVEQLKRANEIYQRITKGG